ncbi:ATM interactor isoform X2 [Salvelinus alpinus]|uniref:ATM interactor isoform X2 n=1 Tax=Salvelinus alpinus TaxID=8036 RepID=UPI0039FC517E
MHVPGLSAGKGHNSVMESSSGTVLWPRTDRLNVNLLICCCKTPDGLVNPTIRKVMKGSQKLYCCPIEGCPRGPNRPFSQFSLVKQHFMKMHAEKKHKCSKCNNGYSTEWDLRRHIEDCGRTYRCTCGCPYASRAALLSHIYRTGHEVPTEHRYPPVKKRKLERQINGAEKVKPTEFMCQIIKTDRELSEDSLPPDRVCHNIPPKHLHKLLLPKPEVALVNFPVMQLAHLPVLLPSTESGVLRSVVLAMDSRGSFSTLHLMPQSMGAMVPHLDPKTLGFRGSMPASRSSLGLVSMGVQVSLESLGSGDDLGGTRGSNTSTNIQTDISYLSRMPVGVGTEVCPVGESSVSSCSQTDISVSAQVLLPVSVETQTFPSKAKATTTIGAQTDTHTLSQLPCPYSSPSQSPYITKQTQTRLALAGSEERAQMDQAIMCSDLFDSYSLSVSTQTALTDGRFRTHGVDDPLSGVGNGLYDDDKSAGGMCFGVQTDDLQSGSVADNQTQTTLALFNDLENILSGHSLSGHQTQMDSSTGCGSGLGSVQEQHTGIDFDFEEFLNAAHIQTQTEESELSGLGADTPLEVLDIQTQTDFLLLEGLGNGEGPGRSQASDLELEMFDTQTQTDLNFLLKAGCHMPLGNIPRQSSFSMSTESSDTETQTDLRRSLTPTPNSNTLPSVSQGDQTRLLSSTETQTVTDTSSEGLGNLFLTSNETQTVMDDFLSADMAWNMESHFSSVETQTCEELFALSAL